MCTFADTQAQGRRQRKGNIKVTDALAPRVDRMSKPLKEEQ